MGLMTWLKSFTSVRGRVQSLYEAGMQKAKREDYAGAVRDYTAALQLSDVPVDQRSMLLFNRALAYSMLKDDVKANDDLNIVVGMRGAPAHIASAAREKLERIRRRGQPNDEHR